MTTTGRFSIVVSKDEYGIKIWNESKIFRVKQKARTYAAELKEKQHDMDWVVVDLEAVLD